VDLGQGNLEEIDKGIQTVGREMGGFEAGRLGEDRLVRGEVDRLGEEKWEE
jgi:hypothetical protein